MVMHATANQILFFAPNQPLLILRYRLRTLLGQGCPIGATFSHF